MTTATLSLNEILARLMFTKRVRTAELARQTELPQATVHRLVTGVTPTPHQSTLNTLANYFSVTIDQLKGLEPIPWLEPQANTESWHRIPILSWEEAVAWKSYKQKVSADKSYLSTDAPIGERGFALVTQDASMEPLFPKGTQLIIDPNKTPKDRSFVVVALKNYPQAIFRQLLIDAPHRYLKPLSPDFENFKMALLGEKDSIIGVLTQARRDYED